MYNECNLTLENELFICEKITDTEENRILINNFLPKYYKGTALTIYLRGKSLTDEKEFKMRTYLVKDKETKELVGYFSLKAGMVSQDEGYRPDYKNGRLTEKYTFDALPGIELANFAVNGAYCEAHEEYEGIGKIIFHDFICPIVKIVSEQIGVYFLFIFALNEAPLINYYQTLNFKRIGLIKEKKLHNRIRPDYDGECIFMCQRIENLY